MSSMFSPPESLKSFQALPVRARLRMNIRDKATRTNIFTGYNCNYNDYNNENNYNNNDYNM